MDQLSIATTANEVEVANILIQDVKGMGKLRVSVLNS